MASGAFSHSGKVLAGGGDQTVALWDWQTTEKLRTLHGHSDYVSTIDFDPQGKIMATGSVDMTVKLWDVASGSRLRTLTFSAPVTSVAFSPDGKTLATASEEQDQTVKLWSVKTGKSLWKPD